MVIPRILLLVGAAVTLGRGLALADVKVVVVEKNRVVLPEPLDRLDLLEEVSKDLAAHGCPVVESCRTAECQSKAIASGATDVLDIDGEYRREQYSCAVAVELRPTGGGAVKFSSRFANGTCPAMDLVDHAKELATRACAQLLGEPPPPKLDVAPATVETRADRPLAPRGFLVGGGGAVLAGLGVTLWILDGRCAHSAELPGEIGCRDQYSTKAIGIPLALLGVAAMATGGWMVWHDHRVAVAVSPGGVTLTGRF